MKKTELQDALKAADVEFEDSATKKVLRALFDAIEVEDGEDAPKVGASIVPNVYKKRYGKAGNCGDEMAAVLTDATTDDKGKTVVSKLVDVMDANGIDTSRWENLNIGQRRMNLGNVLRARITRGEFVNVGDAEWNPKTEEAVA